MTRMFTLIMKAERSSGSALLNTCSANGTWNTPLRFVPNAILGSTLALPKPLPPICGAANVRRGYPLNICRLELRWDERHRASELRITTLTCGCWRVAKQTATRRGERTATWRGEQATTWRGEQATTWKIAEEVRGEGILRWHTAHCFQAVLVCFQNRYLILIIIGIYLQNDPKQFKCDGFLGLRKISHGFLMLWCVTTRSIGRMRAAVMAARISIRR
jgi:hypothetical protein